MYRKNTPADVANTGRVHIDTGDGVQVEVPVAPVPDLAARLAAIEYDSGLRDITALAGGLVTSGNVLLRRQGSVTTLDFENVKLSPSVVSGSAFITIPQGFRRPRRWDDYVTSGIDSMRSMFMFPTGGIGIWNAVDGDKLRFTLTWITNDPPPTTPPGSPA